MGDSLGKSALSVGLSDLERHGSLCRERKARERERVKVRERKREGVDERGKRVRKES